MSTLPRSIIRIVIQSLHGFIKELTCLLIFVISDLVPSEIFSRNSIKILVGINLADSEFHLSRSVDLLIDASAILSLFSVRQINLSRKDGDLYL